MGTGAGAGGRGRTVAELFERSVAARGHATAVRAPDGVITYAELAERADRLARWLRRIGVTPGELVGLCLERSAALVVAALATFKAGAAYLAIDPEYPRERVRWMLGDAGVQVVITDAATAPRLGEPEGRSLVLVGPAGSVPERQTDDVSGAVPGPAAPDDLAYVVYTSGSSGRPKGVMIEHAGLFNLVQWHRNAFSLIETDRTTQIASPGFDATAWEVWSSLAVGAAIHVVPGSLRTDPVALRDWLIAQEITVSFIPTAIAEHLIGLDWPADHALRYLLTGGDALTRRPAPGLGFTLVNNYGLSETAVVATSGEVAPDDVGVPSIGRPITGVELEVVDEALRPVPVGVEGELVIGGVALARGYLRRPELSAQRFLELDRGRRYLTGDRVRQRPSGEVEFLGRIDDQVSVRGFRVEPGEVVASLNAHPGISASVVLGTGDSAADRRLIAYLVASDGNPPDDEALTGFLSRSLPPYMVPSKYVWIDTIALTAHGKVDRNALTAAEAESGTTVRARRPASNIGSATAALIAELLYLDAVEMQDNFFLLGGHSLLGAQLIARLKEQFEVEISLRYLFDHPTAAEIGAEVERQMAADRAGVPVTR